MCFQNPVSACVQTFSAQSVSSLEYILRCCKCITREDNRAEQMSGLLTDGYCWFWLELVDEIAIEFRIQPMRLWWTFL